MWTQVTSTRPGHGDRRRRRLLGTLAWTLIVSSVAAEATWGWAMNRSDTRWMPTVVRLVLEGVDASVSAGPREPWGEAVIRP